MQPRAQPASARSPRPELLPAQLRGGIGQPKASTRTTGKPAGAATAQPKGPARPNSAPPRPHLLPPKLRGGAAQARSEAGGARTPHLERSPSKLAGMIGQPKVDRRDRHGWSGAPRPELLPRRVEAIVQRSQKKHTTKKGNVKESTLDFLKQDKVKVTVKDLVDIWENLKKLFDVFAKEDSDGLPPNTTGNLPLFLDLNAISNDYYQLGKILTDGIGPALNSSRGDHDNEEEKLPVYVGPTPYEEYGYLKSGGRLVLDHTSNRQYISLHYSTFYRIA